MSIFILLLLFSFIFEMIFSAQLFPLLIPSTTSSNSLILNPYLAALSSNFVSMSKPPNVYIINLATSQIVSTYLHNTQDTQITIKSRYNIDSFLFAVKTSPTSSTIYYTSNRITYGSYSVGTWIKSIYPYSTTKLIASAGFNSLLYANYGNGISYTFNAPIIPQTSYQQVIFTQDQLTLIAFADCQIYKFIYNNSWVYSNQTSFNSPIGCLGSILKWLTVTNDNRLYAIGYPGTIIQIFNLTDFSVLSLINIPTSFTIQKDWTVFNNKVSNIAMFIALQNSKLNIMMMHIPNQTFIYLPGASNINSTYSVSLKYDNNTNKIQTIVNNLVTTFTISCQAMANFSQTLGSCNSCNPGCLTCSNIDWTCLSCINPSDAIVLGACVSSTCSDGFYWNSTGCVACLPECYTCNNSLTCLTFINNNSNSTNTNTSANSSIMNTTINNTQISSSINQSSILYRIIAQIFSIPNIRQILVSFIQLFISTDSVWFYQYHLRSYGQKMTTAFNIIRDLEDQKYTFLRIDKIIENQLPMIKNTVDQAFSIYNPLTSRQYFFRQNQNWAFLQNFLNFFLYTIPLGLVIFFIFRRIFYLLFKIKISFYFRSYSFGGYALLMFIEPNIQYFSFLATNQMKMAFSQNCIFKILNLLWILIFFIVVAYCASAYFLFKYFYGKLSKYFLYNCYRLNISFLWMTFDITLKALSLGFIHSCLIDNYYWQIRVLLLLQFSSIILILIIWMRYDCFKSYSVISSRLINSFLFIIFQLFLLFDQAIDDYQAKFLLDEIEYNIVLFIAINCLFSSIANFFPQSKNQTTVKAPIQQNNVPITQENHAIFEEPINKTDCQLVQIANDDNWKIIEDYKNDKKSQKINTVSRLSLSRDKLRQCQDKGLIVIFNYIQKMKEQLQEIY